MFKEILTIPPIIFCCIFSSNITRHKSDHELGGLAILRFVLCEYLSVEKLHSLFEGNELHDGVWHLSGPEWGDTLGETGGSLS